jgi:DNA-binding transcriptional MerR regulator
MKDMLYSIKEIAEQLNTDWQTLLQWKYQYAFSLPIIRQEKQLKYYSQAKELFRFIRDAKASGWEHEEIKTIIDEKYQNLNESSEYFVQTMESTMKMMQTEVEELKVSFDQTVKKRTETLINMLKTVSWEELRELQTRFPDLLMIEEDVEEANSIISQILTLPIRHNWRNRFLKLFHPAIKAPSNIG